MKRSAAACLTVALLLAGAVRVGAHGVTLAHQRDEETGAVTIRAMFDSGDVLDAAQVAVFAPDDPVTPWLTGMTDETGTFSFTPDYTIEGTWDVQVRKAGHGGLLHLTLDASMAATAPNGGAPGGVSVAGAAGLDGAQFVISGDARFVVTGDIVVERGEAPAGTGAATFTPAQIVLMAASVVWGCIGTALFFTRCQRGAGVS